MMVEPLTIPEKCTKHEYCTALHEFSYFVHCLDPPPLSDCKEKEAAHIKTHTLPPIYLSLSNSR